MSTIKFLLLAAVLLLEPGCRSNRGGDLLILRDGATKSGRLDQCLGQICTFDGISIPRLTIQFIGLNGVQPPSPQVEDTLQDEVRLIDASIHRGQVLSIDATRVTTVNATHSRERVVWIYLAQSETSGPATAGTTTRAPKDMPSYLWDGRIAVENTYDGRNGRHKWKGEYVVKFLEVHGISSTKIVPIELKYVIHADANLDRGSYKFMRGANNVVVNGDVRMLGHANGVLMADQLEKGRVLSGDIMALNKPAASKSEIPSTFTSGTQRLEHMNSMSEPGSYRLSLTFNNYGDYRARQPYSPERAKDIRDLYQGIDRTGQHPMFFPDVNQDFLHWVPEGMPGGTDIFGRLYTPEQSEVRGAFSVPVEGGESAGPSDAGRLTVNWIFNRTRK